MENIASFLPNRPKNPLSTRIQSSFKEVMESLEINSNSLNIALGHDENNIPQSIDLSKAPHMLLAGQTGSGKSVTLNSIISSLILSKGPEELKMIMIDPKVVELTPYNDIPHLLFSVATETSQAIQYLEYTVNEMESRFKLLASEKVRNIQSYNEKTSGSKLPYLVVVIDEFADLMYMAKKSIETNIIRIAQKARAVGIHLILATQRPSVNVITGILKANVPTRIAFKVASQIDARTILDGMGAEKLLGAGDMLLKGDCGEPKRIQGCFLSDLEIEIIVNEVISRY